MRSKNIETMNEIKTFVEKYYISHYKFPSTSEISKGVGIGRTTAYTYLVEMDKRGMIIYDGKSIETELTKQTKPKLIRAAILGSVACGLPNLAEENIEGYVSLPEALFGSGEFYILKAKGNSMIDAGIDDGDLVIIKKQSIANDGEIIVALIDDEATLKRFYRDEENKRIILHPENKEMKDIYVDNCIIQGVAVKVIKDLQ